MEDTEKEQDLGIFQRLMGICWARGYMSYSLNSLKGVI